MVSETSTQPAPSPRIAATMRPVHPSSLVSPARQGAQRNSPTSLPCICCSRSQATNVFLCKACTMQKLAFSAKKAKILGKLQTKRELIAQAESLIHKVHGDDLKVEELETRIEMLRSRRNALKIMIEEKQKETASIKSVYTRRVGSLCDKIEAKFPSLEVQRDRRFNIENRQNQEIANGMVKLSRLRRELMIPLFYIFPVREVRPVMNNSEIASTPTKKEAWAVLQDLPPRGANDAPIYEVRDAMCCLESPICRSDLSEAIEKGTLSLPRQFQTQLAAFMSTVQLVNLLAQVNDIVLPHSMSTRDICVWERWSPALLETDWFKLCHCVYTICLAYQLKAIQFLSPHHNLILLADKVQDGPIELISPHGLDQRQISEAKEKLRWRERDHLAEWDTCEDVEDVDYS